MTSSARFVRSAARACCAAAAALAFIAALEPSIHADRGPLLRILVHDASASCGARASPDDEEIAALLHSTSSGDLVAALSFGARPGAMSIPCAPAEFRDVSRASAARAIRPDPHGSSLFAAIGTAARTASQRRASDPDRRLEILVATDARATDATSDALSAASAELRAANCTSFRVLRVASDLPGAFVSELRGPGAARAGEPFALELRGVAAQDGALVELRDAAGVLETRRVSGKGPFRLVFTRIEERAGPVSFSARMAGESSIPPPVARVVVSSPGRALVLGTVQRVIPGIDGDWRDVRGVREDAGSEFAARDLVVLDDVPSAVLAEIDGALRSYVVRGGGLLLLGGPNSFGAGGWAGRPIEALSPFVSRPRDDSGPFVYVALDGSGSMAESWGSSAGAVTRDSAARSAALALVRFAAPDTVLALRRFAGRLLPPGAPAQAYRLDPEGAASARSAIDALPQPGGATALLPPLAEALSMASSRGAGRKAALILTDGRTAESEHDLHAALAALDAAGVSVTLVIPGGEVLGDEAGALRSALSGTRAVVRGATSPERLADIFRGVEEAARAEEPVIAERKLRLVADSAVVDASCVPERASRIDRVWPAEGCAPFVVTEASEPFAAAKRVGLGTVTALASRPGDDAWLGPSDAAERLVRALARFAIRAGSGRFRVERDGAARLLVRFEPGPAGRVPAFVETGGTGARTRTPLQPAEAGLLAAEFPVSPGTGPEWIDLVSDAGHVAASAGLDSPAPAEYRDPPPADLDALATLATRGGSPPGTPLAPWLAGAAVVLALASIAVPRVKSERHPAR